MVIEFIPYGDLYSFLSEKKDHFITWKLRLRMVNLKITIYNKQKFNFFFL